MGKKDLLRYISSLKKALNLAIFLPKIRRRTSAFNISEKAQKGRGGEFKIMNTTQGQPLARPYVSYASDLDANLYAPLESAIQEPYPLSFARMLNSSRSRGIDVVLQEGPYTTYIAEYPGYAKNCQYFSLELSFMNHGFVDSGWLLDSPVHFFLLYFPIGEEGEPPTKLKALLVAKARLLQELSRRGFNRAMLADRDEMLRQSNMPGAFKTADPGISIFYKTDGDRKPVYVRVDTSILESIAAGNFIVPVGDGPEELQGTWLGRQI